LEILFRELNTNTADFVLASDGSTLLAGVITQKTWCMEWRFCNNNQPPPSYYLSRVSGRHTMAYLRALLSVVAALLLAILGPPLLFSVQHPSTATGLGVFRVLSPLCAILTVVFFALFFAAGRLNSKSLRLLLFWTPVTLISTFGLGFLGLFAYAWLHIPRR
jgi:hypothetical protein